MAGLNHFDYVPSTISHNRSVFKYDKHIATSCEIGYLYPMCAPIRMLPGSSAAIDFACEVRSGALIAPLMQEFAMDIFSFVVPNRIVWEHWKQFLGATDDVLFDNLTDYEIPSFKYLAINSDTGVSSTLYPFTWCHLIANYFELPYTVNSVEDYEDTSVFERINALPFRGYNFIWNEFFRPEQLVDPVLFAKTDNGWDGDNVIQNLMGITWNGVSNGYYLVGPASYTYGDDPISGGVILPTFRVHKSLWTSCLPKPSLETLNLLATVGEAPVGFVAGATTASTSNTQYAMLSGGSSIVNNEFTGIKMYAGSTETGVTDKSVVADVSQAVLTVNNYLETRMLQNYYNTLNRTGSRYDTIIKALFHTVAPEAVIDIPELIVHKRFLIYRKQVVASASTDYNSTNVQMLGQQGAYIDTAVSDSFFTKSTTEHGYIHLLYTIRPLRIMMSNGIEPMWQQLGKFDQYYSCFDGMGDVPRFKKEVFLPTNGIDATAGAVFGYQEYGAEYKYQRTSATGNLGTYHDNNMSYYTLAEKLASAPTLATSGYAGYNSYISCLVESEAFSRVLAISSPLVAPQFILDIRLTGKLVHPMPVYNIPGNGDLL